MGPATQATTRRLCTAILYQQATSTAGGAQNHGLPCSTLSETHHKHSCTPSTMDMPDQPHQAECSSHSTHAAACVVHVPRLPCSVVHIVKHASMHAPVVGQSKLTPATPHMQRPACSLVKTDQPCATKEARRDSRAGGKVVHSCNLGGCRPGWQYYTTLGWCQTSPPPHRLHCKMGWAMALKYRSFTSTFLHSLPTPQAHGTARHGCALAVALQGVVCLSCVIATHHHHHPQAA